MTHKSLIARIVKDFKMHKTKYLIILPIIIYLVLFCYKPMYGILIAFKDFRVSRGIMDSPWVGFKHFERFFNDINFRRLLKNTLTISFYSIIFSFPAPVILALLLNEVKSNKFKRVVQTITYMPHFIAVVVVCGLITTFCVSNGLFNDIIACFGGERQNLLSKSQYFYTIYILSDIWQEVGWNSIIYLAALSGVDQEQYEAAKIDGAGRIHQLIYITLPGILPTVIMMLILRMGAVLSVGYEKILLIYQPLTYEVADVISTYTYRKGVIDADYSYSTAIGLFNSLVNIVFLIAANKIAKKAGQDGLF